MPLLESLISAIAPHTCLHCLAEGSLLCQNCQTQACPAVPPRCFRCYTPTAANATCTSCQNQTILQHVWVGTEYVGPAKELVYKLKFHRARAAVESMAALMSGRLPHLSEDAVLVPVPTATGRVRQRGYDQAAELARQLARINRLRTLKLLRRTGQFRQVGANRQKRLLQLQTAFYTPQQRLNRRLPRHVVLVDDISTTGATLESAARTLRQAGVKHIDAVVFAQKV